MPDNVVVSETESAPWLSSNLRLRLISGAYPGQGLRRRKQAAQPLPRQVRRQDLAILRRQPASQGPGAGDGDLQAQHGAHRQFKPVPGAGRPQPRSLGHQGRQMGI